MLCEKWQKAGEALGFEFTKKRGGYPVLSGRYNGAEVKLDIFIIPGGDRDETWFTNLSLSLPAGLPAGFEARYTNRIQQFLDGPMAWRTESGDAGFDTHVLIQADTNQKDELKRFLTKSRKRILRKLTAGGYRAIIDGKICYRNYNIPKNTQAIKSLLDKTLIIGKRFISE